ncbi:MAG: hypothetical protein SXG53_28445 [Pseudomonadota bacterium]|nr:hypothetical protein [Pseudomonadota bacterium]
MNDASKKADAEFLVSEFDIAPMRAAVVVTDDEEQADRIGAAISADQISHDHLSNRPVPGKGKDPQHEEGGVEDLEKPVDNRDSAAT